MLYWTFVAGTGLTDRLIRGAEVELGHPTLAPTPAATHVRAIRRDRDGRLGGIEACPLHVRRFDPATEPPPRVPTRTYRVPASAVREKVFWRGMESHVGEWYGFGAVCLAYAYLKTGRRHRFFESRTARFDCVAVIVYEAIHAGIPTVDVAPVDTWPSLLEGFCAQHYDCVDWRQPA